MTADPMKNFSIALPFWARAVLLAGLAYRHREGGEPLTDEDVRAFCRGRIAHYKVPRYVLFVEEFPMTVTGKVRKVEMRAQAVEILGLEDAASTRHA